MARVTVEDCVDKIPNRFELVLVAAQRAKNIAIGAPITVDRDNDKNPVVALREIADGTVDKDNLKNNLINSLQKIRQVSDPVVEEKDIVEALEELSLDGGEYAYVVEAEKDIALTQSFEVTDTPDEK